MNTIKTNKEALKKKKDLTGLRRALYIVGFACMLAIGAYFIILVDTPDMGQKVLGGFALASAIHYFVLAIR